MGKGGIGEGKRGVHISDRVVLRIQGGGGATLAHVGKCSGIEKGESEVNRKQGGAERGRVKRKSSNRLRLKFKAFKERGAVPKEGGKGAVGRSSPHTHIERSQ